MDDDAPLIILTNARDVSADLVVLEAARQGLRIVRLNTDTRDILTTHDLRMGHAFGCRSGSRSVRAPPGAGIWYRRPEAPTDPSWTPGVQSFVADQWRDHFEALEDVERVRWMSEPSRIRRAENKIAQLRAAPLHGFSVPATIVTNDHDEFMRFRAQYGRIVAKPLATGVIEASAPTGDQFVFANEVTSSDGPTDLELRAAPIIVQQLLTHRDQLRVTVVGRETFCARIKPDASVRGIDWRDSASSPAVSVVAAPAALANAATSLVRAFGLAFSSMDVIRQGDDFYFLDLNPNGEWGLQRSREVDRRRSPTVDHRVIVNRRTDRDQVAAA